MARLVVPAGTSVLLTNKYRLAYKATNDKRDSFIREAASIVKELMEDERKRVVTAVQGAVNVSAVYTLSAAQVRESDYSKFLVALYGEVTAAFDDETRERLGLPKGKSFFQALVSEYIRKYVAERVVSIVSTTRQRLKEGIDASIQEGLSIPNIARRINSLYLDEILPSRSTVIARTEVISASNAGSYLSAKSTGLPLKKVWLSTADFRTRDEHASADGQRVGIDEAFVVGGERLLFPGDGSLGASAWNKIQCRCTVYYETA